jgi:hypothetical protein
MSVVILYLMIPIVFLITGCGTDNNTQLTVTEQNDFQDLTKDGLEETYQEPNTKINAKEVMQTEVTKEETDIKKLPNILDLSFNLVNLTELNEEEYMERWEYIQSFQ